MKLLVDLVIENKALRDSITLMKEEYYKALKDNLTSIKEEIKTEIEMSK
jgi:hypothetical protein